LGERSAANRVSESLTAVELRSVLPRGRSVCGDRPTVAPALIEELPRRASRLVNATGKGAVGLSAGGTGKGLCREHVTDGLIRSRHLLRTTHVDPQRSAIGRRPERLDDREPESLEQPSERVERQIRSMTVSEAVVLPLLDDRKQVIELDCCDPAWREQPPDSGCVVRWRRVVGEVKRVDHKIGLAACANDLRDDLLREPVVRRRFAGGTGRGGIARHGLDEQ
jgi:hypothetical protein